MNPQLQSFIRSLNTKAIPDERKLVLTLLIDAILHRRSRGEPIRLNFICTHNSRRSQLAQVWGHCAAVHFDIPVTCFSGGVEVTAFNERAVASLKRSGFDIDETSGPNPKYTVQMGQGFPPLQCFSKTYDDPANQPSASFIAVMTCAHADDNCPFIPNASERIAVRYEDPKAFDNTPLESEKYDERSQQIATEMLYVFEQLTKA